MGLLWLAAVQQNLMNEAPGLDCPFSVSCRELVLSLQRLGVEGRLLVSL